jgi:hypothetical protein
MTEREFWLAIRSALLMFIDAIERKYGLERTSEIRKACNRCEL